MQRGTVVGHATATVKHPSLAGWRLLIVQPEAADGGPDGEPIIAIDDLGAAVGAAVAVCNDGAHARAMVKTKASPVRWFVMGLYDA